MNDQKIIEKFKTVRSNSLLLCEKLESEDLCLQPVSFVSPLKWHLGHTSWFFEKLVLQEQKSVPYTVFHDKYDVIFNSYYKSLGEHWQQSERAVLSRPTILEIYEYRKYIDASILDLLKRLPEKSKLWKTIEIGIEHEMQHQELMLMDIKYCFSLSPMDVSYLSNSFNNKVESNQREWTSFKEDIYEIGVNYSNNAFCFDNETPKHKVYSYGFSMSNCLLSNAEYLEFVENSGYSMSNYWLSDAWDWLQAEGIKSPLYWKLEKDNWLEFGLDGWKALNLSAPVKHISFYEANAFANYKAMRLPTEQEWEIYHSKIPNISQGKYLSNYEHSIFDLENNLWQWTSSSYSAYPKYKAPNGALAEYNGKFMSSQFVLRGGCYASPKGHFRNTYRNFYFPQQRWMFSGIRLAKDLE